MIDTEDLEKLINYKYTWCASYAKRVDGYYAHVTIYLGKINGKEKHTKLALQTFLMNPTQDKGIYIDHINHDTLDNRRENLRVASNGKNLRNRSGRNKNNTSGYRNVCWLKSCDKWCVQLQVNGKNTILGKFDNIDEAGAFAEEMRKKYYGEYAGNN